MALNGRNRRTRTTRIARARLILTVDMCTALLSRLAYRRPRKVAPCTREKSQSRDQHDSPSLSPAQDGSSPLSYFRALAALSLWGGLLFAPGIGGDRSLNHNELLTFRSCTSTW